MAVVVYKCPGCGSFLQDDTENDIIKCPNCGTSVTKELTEQDKNLRYLKEKEIREQAERMEEKQHKRKESRKAEIAFIVFIVICFLYLFLHEKGII